MFLPIIIKEPDSISIGLTSWIIFLKLSGFHPNNHITMNEIKKGKLIVMAWSVEGKQEFSLRALTGQRLLCYICGQLRHT
jgi:hypothetical protein